MVYIENPLYYYYVSTNLPFSLVELETYEFLAVCIEETQQNTKNTVNR